MKRGQGCFPRLFPIKGGLTVIKKQVLIVMDDTKIGQSLKARLENSVIKIDCAASLSEALECAIKNHYCLLIIDLQISLIGNAELVRILRVTKHAPILALTDVLETREKIVLFHAGVNAFIEKPFDVDLCIAQANALIELHIESDEGLGKSIPITFGASLVIAPRYRQVLVQGTPVELTRIEFDLLYFMAKHPGQVFSRRELYDYVWDDYFELGGDETVKSHIKALRKKFAGLGRDIIETVWAVGYRFIPPE